MKISDKQRSKLETGRSMKRVTFEQAKRLKDLGYPKHFDWIYSVADRTDLPPTQHWGEIENYQPTLHEVCDWLREEKGINLSVHPEYYHKGINYCWQLTWYLPKEEWMDSNISTGTYWYNDNAEQPTYNDMLSSAIDKALEILEKKI